MAKTKLLIRRSYINSNGEATIYVRYSHGDKTVDFSTGERIPVNYWDDDNQRVRKSYQGHNGINNFIEQKRNEIDNLRLDLKVRKIEPTVDAVKKEYKKEEQQSIVIEQKSEHLFDHWQDFISYLCGVRRVGKATIKQYSASKNVFEGFESYVGYPLTFETINQDFYDTFTQYAYDVKEYAPNSLAGKIKHLKSFMEWAVSKEITTNHKFKKFRKPSNETSMITLSIEELNQLFRLDLSSDKKLEKARDIFVLGCASGLRFSDYSVLKSANLKDDYIIISTEKMDREVRVPLNDYSKRIIAKYPKGLPTLSNANLNKYIKEVGILAEFSSLNEVVTFKGGIKQKHFKPLYSLLTSHTARRTFATQSLERGMKMFDVMKITGHRDVKSFSRYVHVAELRLKEEVNKAWNTLSTVV